MNADESVATARGNLADRLAEFFDEELTPIVRRMSYRSPHPALAGDDNEAVRAMVWRGLVSLGAFDAPLPQTELVRAAERLGAVLYQGPLADTLTAMELLRASRRSELLRPGESVALAAREDGTASPADPAAMSVAGSAVEARRDFVNAATEADHLVVVGRTVAGVRIALVPRDHPTVTVRRHVDVGRGDLCHVRLAGTPVTAWLGDEHDWARALAGARIRQSGYLVGLAQGALDLAVAHARTREQFGQPIGRFQSIAFRLSALTARIDGARLLARDAAAGADRGEDPRLAAAQCLATAADVARAATTEAVQVHGAAGLREDRDVQLYHRRSAIDALWLGTPTQLRAEALPLLKEKLSA